MKKYLKALGLCLAICACANAATAVSAADTASFSDVVATDYFYPAAQWGVESGITNGVDENSFDPDGEVTRAQAVTFLWRMAGEPVPSVTETFTDVEKGSWYETAVKWAVENEITNGTGEGKFSPDVICDRAMCLSMLYRMMGSPFDGMDITTAPVELNDNSTPEEISVYYAKKADEDMRNSKMFTDVTDDAYYKLPFLWGYINAIITDDNTGKMEPGVEFNGSEPCVRKEMISFLYQTKLMEEIKAEPEKHEFGALSILIPNEYKDILYHEANTAANTSDEEELIVVSEKASREAADAIDKNLEGAGELFRLDRISENKMHEKLCGDMSGQYIFAKDKDGKYYMVTYPTDVRLVRESNEKMTEDMDAWTELNNWARGDMVSDALAISDVEKVSYTNTLLDMYLAQIAYQKDVKYTLSTTEFGPLEPGDVDPVPYVERLLSGNFVEAEDAKAPDGEYVVLDLPEEEVRFDFFIGDKTLVREVRGENETIYKCEYPGEVSNTDTMQEWYDALAAQAGKKAAK